ncbi:hypothetical protein BpHYR1_042703 [Brachionus plicatilis]|uniref:Uncharacterized protein n=1 Tax=Brachionus plicatilis TaxID=10195 RepID=A0A3M7R0J8_BRAPC|nr:hypothetical protein BpHYR1_042703 [Brachionus plicatilis]
MMHQNQILGKKQIFTVYNEQSSTLGGDNEDVSGAISGQKITKKAEKSNDFGKFGQKFDELSDKLTKTLTENSELHSKLEKIGNNCGSGEADDNELRKQIRHHAMLVLEENKTLNDQIEVSQENLLETRRKAIIENKYFNCLVFHGFPKKQQLKPFPVDNDVLKYCDKIILVLRYCDNIDYNNHSSTLLSNI